MAVYPARCGRCARRRNLSMLPQRYIREPRCKFCGGRMYVDWYRTSGREAKGRKASGKTCDCGIPHYPHHRGSVYGCDGYPEAQEKALSD